MNSRYIDPTNQPLDKSIPPAPLGKRCFAFLFDLMCLFIFSTFLNSTIVPALQKNFYNQEDLKNQVLERLLSTHLYVENEEKKDTYYLIYNMYTEDNVSEEDKLKYIDLMENNLNLLITEANFSCYTMDDLTNLKAEAENVFYFNQELNQFEYVEGVETDAKVDFYRSACKDAYKKITTKDDFIVTSFKKINRINMIEIMSCLTVVGIVIFLVIPLCSKKGQTLGKKMNGLALVEKEDQPIRKMTIVFRYLILFFVEIIASIFLYGIPLLISLTIMCFSKKRGALHDVILSTKTILAESYPQKKSEDDSESQPTSEVLALDNAQPEENDA